MTLHSLPVFVRLQGRAVILVGSGEAADAKRRLLERAGAVVVRENGVPFGASADGGAGISSSVRAEPAEALPFSSEVESAAPFDAAGGVAQDKLRQAQPERKREPPPLAIVVDDEAAVSRLKARGILVNAVDRPELCDFTLPAIVDRDPVIVAIGTGGASAGLAAALRQRLEALIPVGIGALARSLFSARAVLRERWPQADARRRALARGMAPGGALDPLGGDHDVAAWIAAGADESEPSLVHITLRSHDPDDLTLREARALAQADRVTHAADVPAAILNRARADASRVLCDAPPLDGGGLTVDVRWA